MIRLAYLSSSLLPEHQRQDALVDILEVSTKKNADVGLTGVLVHGAGMFMQVLEGPDAQVLKKYAAILDDPRHADCQLLLITTTEERAFPGWSMAAFEGSKLDFHRVQEFYASRKETSDAKAFTDLIQRFVRAIHRNTATHP